MGLVDDNLFEWEILLVGPADTLYEVRFRFRSLQVINTCKDVDLWMCGNGGGSCPSRD